jgi:hypothetical protein
MSKMNLAQLVRRLPSPPSPIRLSTSSSHSRSVFPLPPSPIAQRTSITGLILELVREAVFMETHVPCLFLLWRFKMPSVPFVGYSVCSCYLSCTSVYIFFLCPRLFSYIGCFTFSGPLVSLPGRSWVGSCYSHTIISRQCLISPRTLLQMLCFPVFCQCRLLHLFISKEPRHIPHFLRHHPPFYKSTFLSLLFCKCFVLVFSFFLKLLDGRRVRTLRRVDAAGSWAPCLTMTDKFRGIDYWTNFCEFIAIVGRKPCKRHPMDKVY